jgi:hypothetical protein
MISTIDARRGLVVTRLIGPVTEDEVEDHNSRLGIDPQFKPYYKQLVDLSELTEILYDSEAVRDTAQRHVFLPGVKRALVAFTEAAYGMSRMFATQSESAGQNIRVFRDIASAEEWLDA